MVILAVGPERLIVVQGTDPAGDSGSTATAKTQMQSPGSDARAHAPAAEVKPDTGQDFDALAE